MNKLTLSLPRAPLAGFAALGLLLAAAPRPEAAAGAAAAAAEPAVVSHVKILSEHVEDVSSVEAWRKTFIKPGMTDRQKALAVWETVVKFRHQDQPPNEHLQDQVNVHDAIKTFNVYGYGMCCC